MENITNTTNFNEEMTENNAPVYQDQSGTELIPAEAETNEKNSKGAVGAGLIALAVGTLIGAGIVLKKKVIDPRLAARKEKKLAAQVAADEKVREIVKQTIGEEIQKAIKELNGESDEAQETETSEEK